MMDETSSVFTFSNKAKTSTDTVDAEGTFLVVYVHMRADKVHLIGSFFLAQFLNLTMHFIFG